MVSEIYKHVNKTTKIILCLLAVLFLFENPTHSQNSKTVTLNASSNGGWTYYYAAYGYSWSECNITGMYVGNPFYMYKGYSSYYGDIYICPEVRGYTHFTSPYAAGIPTCATITAATLKLTISEKNSMNSSYKLSVYGLNSYPAFSVCRDPYDGAGRIGSLYGNFNYNASSMSLNSAAISSLQSYVNAQNTHDWSLQFRRNWTADYYRYVLYNPNPAIEVTYTLPFTVSATSTSLCTSESTTLSATTTCETPTIVSYSWTPTEGLSDASVANPVFTASSGGSKTYTCTATFSDGYIAQGSVTLNVVVPPTLDEPNTSENPICENSTLTLTPNVTSAGSGCASWQYAWTDGSKWWNGTAFSSASEVWNASYTSVSYKPAEGEYTYTSKVRCSTCTTCGETSPAATVTVNPLKKRNHTASVCQGEAYSYHGTEFETSSAGPVEKDVQFAADEGCDSLVHVTLTVIENPAALGDHAQNHCIGDVPTALSDDVTASGGCTLYWSESRESGYSTAAPDVSTAAVTDDTYYFYQQNAAGCVSDTNNYVFIVSDFQRRTHTASVNVGESFSYHGEDFETSVATTIEKDVQFVAMSGCDSLVHVVLTVLDVVVLERDSSVSVCYGGSISYKGNTQDNITSDMNFDWVYDNGNGTDSTIHFHVTLLPTPAALGDKGKTYCYGDDPTALNDDVTPSTGHVLYWSEAFESGYSTAVPAVSTTSLGNKVYYFYQQSAAGCKSDTNTYTVIVFNLKHRTHTATVCQNEPYSYKDSVFTTSGLGLQSKDVRFSNMSGCDSVVTVNLTVIGNSDVSGVVLKDTCYEMGKSTLLKVESPSGTATYRFYDSGHTLLHTGTEYTTAALSSDEVYYVTIQEPSTCESAEKMISMFECGGFMQVLKNVDNASVCKNHDIIITTVIDKSSPTLLHKVRLVEDFPFTDLELISVDLKIGGKAVPYSRDIANNKLYFNLGELSGTGTYTLTIKARAFANIGSKTSSCTLTWENEATGKTASVNFTVVDN